MKYSDQEILYAMFIIKANHYSHKHFFEYLSEETLVKLAVYYYADLFADRAIAEDN
jgi:hypothetical protein